MISLKVTITEFLNIIARMKGTSYRDHTIVRHAGGSDVVIEYPEGRKEIVSAGRLRLMTQHLKNRMPTARIA